MPETNFFEGFGIKAKGGLVLLFIMGFVMHFYNVTKTISTVIMIFAAFLLTVNIVIGWVDKAKRGKR